MAVAKTNSKTQAKKRETAAERRVREADEAKARKAEKEVNRQAYWNAAWSGALEIHALTNYIKENFDHLYDTSSNLMSEEIAEEYRKDLTLDLIGRVVGWCYTEKVTETSDIDQLLFVKETIESKLVEIRNSIDHLYAMVEKKRQEGLRRQELLKTMSDEDLRILGVNR